MKRIRNSDSFRNQVGCSLILISIFLLGAVLRIWGINFGLPFSYHVDEPAYISAALNLGAGNIGRQLNPPFLPNLLFLEYGFYYIVERIVGTISSISAFETLYRTDPSMFFLLGRLTIASMGILNVLVVYLIGKKASNNLVGGITAFFLAISFLHVRDSHFAVPDVLMTLLVSTTVLFLLFAIEEKKYSYLYIAAFISGMAIASKWSAWPVVIPLGYVFVLRHYANLGDLNIGRIVTSAGVTFLCALVGFFLPSFQLLLKPGAYLSYAFTELRSGSGGGFGIWQIDTVPGYLFYFNTLWYGIGALLLMFGIIGLLRHIGMVLKRSSESRVSVVLLLFPLVYYVVMGSTRHYFARYALPLIPFLVFFASEVLVATVATVKSRWERAGWILFAVLIIALSAESLFNSVRFDYLMTQTDTRTIAKSWIEKNIPAGSKIALEWPVYVPTLSAKEYDITVEGEMGLANHPIDFYRQEGFDYLISSSYIYEIPLVLEDLDNKRRDFYNSLEKEADLIKVFNPSNNSEKSPFVFDEIYGPFVSIYKRERPGPTLKIFYIGD